MIVKGTTKRHLHDFRKSALQTIQAALLLLCAIPNAVHVGKSFKCSWANWFVFMEDTCTSLVMMSTLCDYASPEIKRKFKKVLSLECGKNKDRMAVEPILKLSHPEVIQQLQQAEAVVLL